jgi:hypothetical protein
METMALKELVQSTAAPNGRRVCEPKRCENAKAQEEVSVDAIFCRFGA